MKRSLLSAIQELLKSRSKKPWASFETSGPSADGQLQFSISWNKSFIKVLKDAGYEGQNEEELVQLFFISTHMLPEEMIDEVDTVNPEGTPRLSSEANILRR